MMSDLAPFVAAVIRDRVMAELKDEIEALRQENAALKLERHKRNPSRPVKVTGRNGKEILAENEMDLEELKTTWGRKVYFCNPLVPGGPNTPKTLWFGCGLRGGSWVTLELWIDGGSSVRLQDLSLHYTRYQYICTHRSEYNYLATVEARDGDGLSLEIKIFISPDDHAKLLNREQSVDYLPPETERENGQYDVENDFDQEIPLSHLLALCGENDAMAHLKNWNCTEEWFRRHLMVSYEPYSYTTY
jgi:hypothetical protein